LVKSEVFSDLDRNQERELLEKEVEIDEMAIEDVVVWMEGSS
jgi:hypothetical protein